MASLARQRLSSATKSAIRRFSTPISPLRVGVRALSASSPSGRIENKANGDKNANTLSAQEQQRINNDIPLTPLPEFATGNGNGEGQHDWSKSYFGLSSQAFSKEIAEILTAPLDPLDIEIKPDGLIYLPEIKYRRVLNKAFGPGAWGLAPRGETNVSPKIISREYALVCQGRLVAIARGEQDYFDPSGIPTATEACKSNALMRCSKDLGIASELWDPRFIREFKEKYCVEVFAEHVPTKKKKKLWRRKDQPKLSYPYQES
ncbi:hypothetical protein AX14_004191 [Amanita brunnescens Koide BX004]|nr:hypothetical protein AX14_004191 [Amanita brunnescens Koide BX004]